MGYKNLETNDIDPSVIYVSKKELMARTGVPNSTMHRHIVTDTLNAFRFRNRTYFHPTAAEEYEKLVKCGLLG
jgi:hypothetical protein